MNKQEELEKELKEWLKDYLFTYDRVQLIAEVESEKDIVDTIYAKFEPIIKNLFEQTYLADGLKILLDRSEKMNSQLQHECNLLQDRLMTKEW